MLMGEFYEIWADLHIVKVRQYSDVCLTESMEFVDARTNVATLGEATKTTTDILKLLKQAGLENYSVTTVNSK
jgi:hypothetical protein